MLLLFVTFQLDVCCFVLLNIVLKMLVVFEEESVTWNTDVVRTCKVRLDLQSDFSPTRLFLIKSKINGTDLTLT